MRLPALLLILLAVFAPRASAEAPPAAAALPPVHAARTDRPVVVDGLLSEEAWNGGQPTANFTQEDPDQGVPPRQRTEVRMAYDDDALYIGARMYDSAPDSVVARLSRRDSDASSDRFAVMLDPFHDKRTGYYFMVSAAGTLMDGVLLNDGWDDSSWDGVWQGRVHRDDKGWTCELRIPFSQLRFNAADQMVWGVNFTRSIPRYGESDAVVYTPRGQSGYVSRFPELHGLDGLKTGRHLELTPYVTTKTEHLTYNTGDLSHVDPADPFNSGWQSVPAVGGDLRTSLGSKLTLNATVNPDFGQVEIDPAVVWGLGAHVLKTGLSPVLVDLMERGFVSAIATNGAGIIHDFEIALSGNTSEDVDATLGPGTFGMAEETGTQLNRAISDGVAAGLGLGQAVGKYLDGVKPPFAQISVAATAWRLQIPLTAHVAIGTDIIHMHPQASGAAIGEASLRDFKYFVSCVSKLEGGVYLNCGSAVVLPEVFLKAVAISRNEGRSLDGLTTVNLDFLRHYRPLTNVVSRPTAGIGRGYSITGHHELLIPLLAAALVEGS